MMTGEPVTRSGRWLCSRVVVSPDAASRFDVCRCSICRRRGDGPVFAIEAGDDVRLDGAEHIAVSGSSDWAERGFCRECGTHLFYRPNDPARYAVPSGRSTTPARCASKGRSSSTTSRPPGRSPADARS
jgi:hypothetical protein